MIWPAGSCIRYEWCPQGSDMSGLGFDKRQSFLWQFVRELEEAGRLARRSSDQSGNLAPKRSSDASFDTASTIGRSAQPIRTVHHLACTGGTLFAKCIASMPNVQLLSEVEPLDSQAFANPERFAPTDLLRLARMGSTAVPDSLLVDVFLAGLEPLWRHATWIGRRLVLRDHSHGHFCFGEMQPDRPTLREIVSRSFELRSIVLVRHPVASFLSLRENGWLHFSPASVDEYSARYQKFLDRHADIPWIRYEDFVESPQLTMKTACQALTIPYHADFAEVFGAHRLSGDSGRSGDIIAAREPRPVPPELGAACRDSESLKSLCERLGYVDLDPQRSAGSDKGWA